MESVSSVSKLSTESVGSRRELVVNCVHTADATKQFRRVGVGGVYWALHTVSAKNSLQYFTHNFDRFSKFFHPLESPGNLQQSDH